MSTSGKVLFVFVSVSAVLLYVGALLEAPLSVALSTSEASGIRGGTATCYVDGTGNCPTTTGSCLASPCPLPLLNCPVRGQTKDMQMETTFALAAGSTTDPGHEGTTNQPEIVCLAKHVCRTTCVWALLGRHCDQLYPPQSESKRIPTKVNTQSPACNTP